MLGTCACLSPDTIGALDENLSWNSQQFEPKRIKKPFRLVLAVLEIENLEASKNQHRQQHSEGDSLHEPIYGSLELFVNLKPGLLGVTRWCFVLLCHLDVSPLLVLQILVKKIVFDLLGIGLLLAAQNLGSSRLPIRQILELSRVGRVLIRIFNHF